jgi:hypothetical protein
MKAFLRENPTIAFGLGLPLLLVVVFLLISGIPVLLVAAPQYDVLYATEYYSYAGGGVQISVANQKVQVVYQVGPPNYPTPRIWRYSAKTGAVQEIVIVLPPSSAPPGPTDDASASAPGRNVPIDVPELAGLTVDPASIAPDGYEFMAGRADYRNDIFSELFGFSRYRDQATLTKDGRSVRLPNAGGAYYYGNTRFIGWVVAP